MTWENDNVFIPKYVPQNLVWYEKDRLETWYRQIKCEQFLNSTDLHFAKRKIANFDIIKNNVPGNKLKQYQLINHEEIKNYPLEFQDQIQSSIFRSADHKNVNVSKETIKNILIIVIRFQLVPVDFRKSSCCFFVCFFDFM